MDKTLVTFSVISYDINLELLQSVSNKIYIQVCFLFILFFKIYRKLHSTDPSDLRIDMFVGTGQKDESQNGYFKRTKHNKIFEKQTFLTPIHTKQVFQCVVLKFFLIMN